MRITCENCNLSHKYCLLKLYYFIMGTIHTFTMHSNQQNSKKQDEVKEKFKKSMRKSNEKMTNIKIDPFLTIFSLLDISFDFPLALTLCESHTGDVMKKKQKKSNVQKKEQIQNWREPKVKRCDKVFTVV